MLFTDFYSVAYVLVALTGAILFTEFYIFRTLFQRFVLMLAVLTATIPLVGLACWALGIHVLPIFNVLGVLIFSAVLYSKKPLQISNLKLVDKFDLVGGGLALVPVLILCASYATAPNLSASLFQLSSEGWDNGSHILMMEDNSRKGGYVYGPYEDLKSEIVQESNAYPQAWHLTTSHLANGFGGNRFIPTNPMGVILAYTIATLLWLVATIYLFNLCMWRFYLHISKSKQPGLKEVSVLISVSMVVTLVVFIGAFMHGFTNYIGTLAYLFLSVAMMLEFVKRDGIQNYSLFIIFSLAAILSWFLVLPAFALAFILLIFAKYVSIKEAVSSIRDWKKVAITIVAAVAGLFQLYIFQRFSHIGGEDQLNEGSLVTPFDMTGSPLHISHVLFGLIIVTFMVYILRNTLGIKLKKLLLAIVVPWLTLVILVYVYQNITAGQNSYYLTKVVGLCFAATLIPVGALLAATVSRVRIPSPLLSPILAILVAFTLLFATGQPLYGLNKLFQKHARTTYGTAEKTVEYLPKTVDGEAYIVVLTGRKSYEGTREDHHGKLEMRVVHQPLNCTYDITGYISIKTAVKRLAKCADQPYMKNKTIYALVSPASYSRVKELNRSNIKIVKTPYITSDTSTYPQ